MYEVFQTVDLSIKVDAVFKKFDQLLALNTFPTNSSNVQEKVLSALKILETKTKTLDSNTLFIAKLENQIGQLAAVMSRRDENKFPSHAIDNPRANSYDEQVKAVITLRNGKLGIDNGAEIEKKTEKELVSSSNSKTLGSSPMASYQEKVPYLQALLPPLYLRKENKREDILETLKEGKKPQLPLNFLGFWF
ncbi:hypothetical protein M9H77_26807 [Catharanthus roseus]|uniref:Uncharacterized protein n=1 Tax=Catharanthus roseus TaxID=4058 RepID=A0ACC0AB25_CATRO|nr:hypothetical protein M9H77_26807 [Catharanthus roseus]